MPRRRPLLLWFAWLLAGMGMVWASGWAPVSRTQEGRVLETAREMVGRPARDWLIPRLNGEVRLRKPPLAYWASAASFGVFGVGDRAGRLPAVLAGWTMLATTFAVARRLFDDDRTAVFSVAAMAGTWLFFKHALLAETDVYAAAFLTAGAVCVRRAFDATPGSAATRRRDVPWLHALAACAAGVVMAKGPPAAYLVLFAALLAWGRRDVRPLRRFFTSGAVLTLAALALPWFVYVAGHTAEEHQLGGDLLNSAEGGDHRGPPWYYLPLLIKATLPWTGVWAAALVMAGGVLVAELRRRFSSPPPLEGGGAGRGCGDESRDLTLDPPTQLSPSRAEGEAADAASLWVVTAWAASILIPLACWGNKQIHYLLPLMPPTAILIGWALATASRNRPAAKIAAIAVAATAACLSLTGPAVLAGAWYLRPRLWTVDAALASAAVLLAGLLPAAWRRDWRRDWRPGDKFGGQAAGYAVATALAVVATFALTAWLPSVAGGTSRRTAADLRTAFPAAAFAFRGSELPVLSYSLRSVVPLIEGDALAAAAADPRRVVLDQQQSTESPPSPPTGFVEVRRYRQSDNVLHVYVPTTSPWAGACVDID